MASRPSRCSPRLSLVWLVVSCLARAEADGFGVGDGHLGSQVISLPNTTINSSIGLAAQAAAGSTMLSVASTSGFSRGTLALLLQVAGDLVPDGGEVGPHPLAGTVGQWELARVASTGGGRLVLTAPLVQSFAAGVTQVISVPEYTDLTIQADAGIVAPDWTGLGGGVIALLATGKVTVAGAIDASARGFRGGFYVPGTSLGSCLSVDEPFPGGSQKGEGVGSGHEAARTGFGRVLNGAGGGNCARAGGGGGGNAAPGGQGGRSADSSRDVGGRGGLALSYTLPDRLSMGGGGGAGQGNVTLGTSGGRGGGIIFLRASAVEGPGRIRSNGEAARTSAGNSAGNSSAGGGGAGGTIVLRVVQSLFCADLAANGANGGDSNGPNNAWSGPGGGGGGGRIFVEAADVTGCPMSVLCGVAGIQGGPLFGPHGDARPQSAVDPAFTGSLVTNSTGYFAVSPPFLISPANGSVTFDLRPLVTGSATGAPAGSDVAVFVDGVLAGTTPLDVSGQFSLLPTSNLSAGPHRVEAETRVGIFQSARSLGNGFTITGPDAGDADAGGLDAGNADAGLDAPQFLSHASPFGYCAQAYSYSLAGAPSVTGAGPISYRAAPSPSGDAVPATLRVDESSGAIDWTPSAQQEGLNRFDLIASGPGGEAVEHIEVGVICKDLSLAVGCGGCAANPTMGLGVALGLLLWSGRRRR